MNYINPEILAKMLVLAASFLAIVFGFGIVWRVEKKLDLSFKLFLAAIIAFFAGEISGFLYVPRNSLLIHAPLLAKILFAVLFLAAMLTMRNMIRKIDGEK